MPNKDPDTVVTATEMNQSFQRVAMLAAEKDHALILENERPKHSETVMTPQKKHRSLEERLIEFYGKPIEGEIRIVDQPEVDWGASEGAEL